MKGSCWAGLLCGALHGLCLPVSAPAATVTNYLDSGGGSDNIQWPYYYLAVNVGDTVVWLNQQQSPPTNYVESYAGDWKSPVLAPGDSFSFTFTNPGFYAYRTGLPLAGFQGTLSGAVTASGWTDAPPPVTINIPVDGSVLSLYATQSVQASVTNADGAAEIEYYAHTNLIAVATNPPYSVQWFIPSAGTYQLVAKAVDRQGGVEWSQAVQVRIPDRLPDLSLWGTRFLPGGKVLFFYNASLDVHHNFLTSSDNLLTSSLSWGYLASPRYPGIYVDERPPASAGQCRFYGLFGSP